mmetsp:Transcript_12940/g.12568  ORF Transcript_12940/g.12568 Transcript_12940/m.12568 type:complete len:390 (+) Transcript_12940:206-1375(+)|eukprot:CAMPEP_0119043148 /NCGR_PEP_ID=MMETSP1177-20130426/18362_1 /TAXON_ID=2985 /ORGANISM="Ochromonas sp, Strain CCMP1899" /LENGTH=389 /DNA_ID=CAMNT_0007010617 /DNA_START=127 /DNA_END=1296 /DNA_ORIENTATION=-
MELRVARKFRVGPKIGSGSFGEIYAGTDVHSGEEVAIKLEPLKSKHPQLLYESKIYRVLQGGYGIPGVKWFGSEGDYNILVIDLLGPSLEDLFNYCGKKLSLKTVLMLADQMIARLEFMHSRSYIHRDVKPDNFLIGTSTRKHICHVIDFGLAKKYQDPRSGRHIPYIEGKNLTGTARYASVSTHLGVEQSRRDDMESLGFVLMYFLRGSLPWQGLKANTKKQKYQRILERKQATHPENLCAGYPTEFKDYFVHCSSLGFEDRPDYRFLKRNFKDLFERQSYEDDGIYDWDVLKKQQEQGPSDGVKRSATDQAIVDQGVDYSPQLGDYDNPSGVASQNITPRGRDEKIRGQAEDDESGQKKGFISSIRNSLFGSRGAQRPDGSGGVVPG